MELICCSAWCPILTTRRRLCRFAITLGLRDIDLRVGFGRKEGVDVRREDGRGRGTDWQSGSI